MDNITHLGTYRSYFRKLANQYGSSTVSLYRGVDSKRMGLVAWWSSGDERPNGICDISAISGAKGRLEAGRPVNCDSERAWASGLTGKIQGGSCVLLPVSKGGRTWGMIVHEFRGHEKPNANTLIEMLHDSTDFSRHFIPLLERESGTAERLNTIDILENRLASVYLQLNPELRIMSASGAGLSELKFLPDSISGRLFQALTGEPGLTTEDLMAMKSRRFEKELKLINAAGAAHWTKMTSYPEWANQRLKTIHVCLTDINSLMNEFITASNFRESSLYYGNSLIDGIIVCDGSFRLLYRTASAIRILSSYEGAKAPAILWGMFDDDSSALVMDGLNKIKTASQEKWERDGAVILNPLGNPILSFTNRGQSTKTQVKTIVETPIEMSVTYFPAKDPEEQKFILVLRDASNRAGPKSDEHGHDLLSEHMSRLPGAVIITDPSGIISYATAQAQDLTGQSAETLKGKDLNDFVDFKTDLPCVGLIKWKNEGRELVFSFERCADGEIIGYLRPGTTLKTAAAEEVAFSALERIAYSRDEVCWACDLSLSTRYVSPSAKDILGYDQGDFLKHEIGLTYNSESLSKLAEACSEGLKAAHSNNIEWHRSFTVEQAKANRKWLKGRTDVSILAIGNRPVGLLFRTRFRTRKPKT